MRTPRIVRLLLTAGTLLAGTPLMADVKAGVDAWSRGDFNGAVREWERPAQGGDADAQFNLAQAYKLGRGVRQDLARAEALFAKAAAQGHLQASDNYGLLLFQRGERTKALPYIIAAAERGDPRAQYLLGLSHFNGDQVAKDWVRAYALVSLANQAGLEQARAALAQMDQYVPLDQRQQAVALAADLAGQADAARARQLAAADLGVTGPGTAQPPRQSAAVRAPAPAPAPAQAVAAAQRTAGTDSPRTAGADHARPATPPTRPVAAPTRPATASRPAAATPAARPASARSPVNTGPWRVQLGAFKQRANADAAWAKASRRPELAGHPRINVPAGEAIRVQAGGFASQQDAQAACNRLSAAGITCLPMRN